MAKTKADLRDGAMVILILLSLLIVLYLGVAGEVWQWRNPKANRTTFYSEMPAPLRFERMDKYQ